MHKKSNLVKQAKALIAAVREVPDAECVIGLTEPYINDGVFITVLSNCETNVEMARLLVAAGLENKAMQSAVITAGIELLKRQAPKSPKAHGKEIN